MAQDQTKLRKRKRMKNEYNNLSNICNGNVSIDLYANEDKRMTWFISIFSEFSPVFENYVLPFAGLFIIVYVIYLIRFLIGGK